MRTHGQRAGTPRRRAVRGRDAQLGALDAARRDAVGTGRFVLVTGAPGSGRTALLDAATDLWRAAGLTVLRVRGDGFAGLLDVLREQYERLADPLLAGPISALGELCADDAAADQPGRSATLSQVTAAAFALVSRRRQTIVVADDVDAGPGPVTALAAAVRGNCLVVASALAARGRLAALADTVVDLPPLPPDAVRGMLARRYSAPLDDAVLPALTAALGPLAGNPATVLSTAEALARSGRLTVVRGDLCLRDAQAPIALPATHPLVAALHERGPVAVRLVTMAAVTRFGLDDLPVFADATLGDPDRYGETVDALVRDGVLAADPHGGIAPRCPALAARLVEDAGPDTVARLHRAYAAAMFRRAGSGAGADRATLADHVTSAGESIPADRKTAEHLAATADEAVNREPDRAADWLLAALRHADGDSETDEILARLLRLLVRTGRFTLLAEVVRAAAPTSRLPDLAVAAALAAVHTGQPVPAGVAALPGGELMSRLAESWAAGSAPGDAGPLWPGDADGGIVGVHELLLVLQAMRGGLDRGAVPQDRADALLAAGSLGDLASVLQLVLGEHRYGTPVDGPIAAYHRLHVRNVHGDLPGVVSAAREADMTAPLPPPLRHVARLWGAEALALQGRAEEARSWWLSVPDEAPFAALRWWVANGPAGEPRTAAEAADRLRAAHVAYRRQREFGSALGVVHLLTRAAATAARFSLHAEAASWAEIAEADATGDHRRISTSALETVRAFAFGDEASAGRVAGAFRARGDRIALALTTLAVGRVAAEPRAWLLEAQATADAVGSPWLRSAVAAAMRERGVRRPRARAPQAAFSATEREIIELIRQGRTNRQIAAAVRMSEKTIENYLTRLFARTGCRSRVELAAIGLTPNGLTPDGLVTAGGAERTR
ncbi:DNA-binding CsgD family transcriptional regulator [Catenuloplanes nepalensis]|uniref:DNA-binding CsgD family transcriptional regulator n=1 Tax=Catenuloplanes nepalensis TaxID=587533 RepID=A0ABT9MXD7_9ACTN|nr:LuxR C-terminal-related transcriptional regulator [Catenuloplanes nepalensis]MDP9796102.1 DNA-binding CsgD family transcriptional regulator [Catenuloplanes nepalensis]